MPDSTNGQNNGNVTPSVMPTENVTANDVNNSSQTPQAETSNNEATLPAEVSDRTRREFEKLKAEKLAMAQKLKELEKLNQNAQINPVEEIVPAADGTVDLNAVNNAIKQINSLLPTIQNARQEAAVNAEEVKKQKVFEKEPALNPEADTFDSKFAELVRLEQLRQSADGETVDALKAAEKIRSNFYQPQVKQNVNKQKKEVAQQFTPAAPQPVRIENNFRDDALKGSNAKNIGEYLLKMGL